MRSQEGTGSGSGVFGWLYVTHHSKLKGFKQPQVTISHSFLQPQARSLAGELGAGFLNPCPLHPQEGQTRLLHGTVGLFQEDRSQCTRAYQASAGVTFADVPSAKADHTPRPSIGVERGYAGCGHWQS